MKGLGNANQHTSLKKKERGTPTPISQHMRTPHTTQRGSKRFSKKRTKKNNQSSASDPQGMVKENALERREISNVQKQGYIGGLNT
jgi:hypothetical protein